MFPSMVGIFFKRLASILLTAGGWLFAGIRTALDLIGWSTTPDDVGTAMSRLDQFLTWVLSIPWWVPWGFALISTLWLMRVSWPRHRSLPPTYEMPVALESLRTGIVPDREDESITIEQQARDDLEMFVTGHLLPTCYALIHLQSELIRRFISNEMISEMAINGLLRRWDLHDFDDGFKILSGFGDSPPRIPTTEALVGSVDNVEKGYPIFVEQGKETASTIGVVFGKDASIDEFYEEWRTSHNTTIDAYDKIKGDPRMKRDEILKKLHRPVRQTRFGRHFNRPSLGEKLFS